MSNQARTYEFKPLIEPSGPPDDNGDPDGNDEGPDNNDNGNGPSDNNKKINNQDVVM